MMKYCILPVNSEEAEQNCRVRSGGEEYFLKIPLVKSRTEAAYLASYKMPDENSELIVPEEFRNCVETADSPAEMTNVPPEDCQKFHLQAKCGWLNDPNGLYYKDGIWHAFTQYNPFSVKWGNMHWLHFTSRDLSHWEERGICLYPDAKGNPYSGCAVVDYENCSGLGRNGVPPILLFYTNAYYFNPEANYVHDKLNSGRLGYQYIAYSTDNGETFVKMPEPVIPNSSGWEERDPNVCYDPEAKIWRMALYTGNERTREFRLLASKDLLHWTETDRYTMGPGRECPCIRFMKEESTGKYRWVFTESNGYFRIGDISEDGKISFCTEPRRFYLGHMGSRAYAGQFFHNTPNGEHIYMAWQMMAWTNPRVRQSSLTTPVRVTLRDEMLRLSPILPDDLPEDTLQKFRLDRGVKEFRYGDRIFLFDAENATVQIDACVYQVPVSRFEGVFLEDTRSIEYFDNSGLVTFMMSKFGVEGK